MRLNRSQDFIILHWTSIFKIIIVFIISVISMFIITGFLTSLKPEYRISSSSINDWVQDFKGNSLIYLLGFENQYFLQAIPKEVDPPNYSSFLFEMATNINTEDPRSLLGTELPYFSLFDGEIFVAGEGTNYTNMPIESAPPFEVMMEERKASVENLKKMDQKTEPPVKTTQERKVAYIYTTHSRESYLPQLEKATTPDEAYHSKVNVTLVAEKLGEELEERGIGTQVNKTDFTGMLYDKGWDYWQSYKASRKAVETAISQNKDLKFFFDIHRDYQRKKITTVNINGISYARTFFVIGGEHAKYKKNLKLATDLHNRLEEKYPGLSRGVLLKEGPNTNGKFNQDLSENALLIEVGGVDNSLQEVYRTAEAVAEVFSEYYWDAKKVNQSKR